MAAGWSTSMPTSWGARNLTADTMPSGVSPVIVGAEAPSPQPTFPSRSVTRTIRLSAVAISMPASFMGESNGTLIAKASTVATSNIRCLLFRTESNDTGDSERHRNTPGRQCRAGTGQGLLRALENGATWDRTCGPLAVGDVTPSPRRMLPLRQRSNRRGGKHAGNASGEAAVREAWSVPGADSRKHPFARALLAVRVPAFHSCGNPRHGPKTVIACPSLLGCCRGVCGDHAASRRSHPPG